MCFKFNYQLIGKTDLTFWNLAARIHFVNGEILKKNQNWMRSKVTEMCFLSKLIKSKDLFKCMGPFPSMCVQGGGVLPRFPQVRGRAIFTGFQQTKIIPEVLLLRICGKGSLAQEERKSSLSSPSLKCRQDPSLSLFCDECTSPPPQE